MKIYTYARTIFKQIFGTTEHEPININEIDKLIKIDKMILKYYKLIEEFKGIAQRHFFLQHNF